MYYLFIHDDAKADLLAIREMDKPTAARFLVLLQELRNSQDLMDRLTQHDYGAYGTEDFHVTKWFEQWNKGNDLWRLKYWELEHGEQRYRVVYAFIPSLHHYHVLGVVPREFNYEPNHDLTKRILDAYKDLQ